MVFTHGRVTGTGGTKAYGYTKENASQRPRGGCLLLLSNWGLDGESRRICPHQCNAGGHGPRTDGRRGLRGCWCSGAAGGKSPRIHALLGLTRLSFHEGSVCNRVRWGSRNRHIILLLHSGK